jgi:lipopolysaccharide transport system ATP-binding protein
VKIRTPQFAIRNFFSDLCSERSNRQIPPLGHSAIRNPHFAISFMSDTVISVENVGKRYTLSHRVNGERYTTLRDMLARQAAAPFKAIGKKMRFRSGLNGSHSNGSTYPPSNGSVENFWALKDVSFEVKQGEVIGIIGRNGAGKSTLLKILSRITEPTKGRIRIRGRVASLLEVGTGFHPELTGRENVYLNGAILGMTRAEIKAKFDEIVAFAEVEKFLDTPVKRYSSGMYVRLAFAVAAHLEPEILVVDEVLAVGDAEFQKKCLGKMHDVATGGRTVLFVSHQIGAIRRLCTAACLLKSGQTEGITSVDTAVNEYSLSMKESPFDLNLSGIARKGDLGQSAKILRIRIPPESSFQYGEPLDLIFTIECHSPIKNATIGIGFDTLDGYRVMTLDADNTPAPSLELLAGTHEVSFKVDRNPLHPATYNCSVGLVSGTHLLDFAANCAVWEVSPARHGIESTRGYSGCRLPVNVCVTTTEEI